MNYHLNESMKLRAAYWFESYDAEDWATEDVLPHTLGNVPTLGEQVESYDNNVLKLSLIYKF